MSDNHDSMKYPFYIECCGAETNTRFCPNCGKQLVFDDGLLGLLKHVNEHAEALSKKLLSRQQTLEGSTNENDKRYLERQVKSVKKAAAKWSHWAVALKSAVEKLEKE